MNNSIVLNYLNDNNIDLEHIGINEIRSIIYNKTIMNDEIEEIKQFKTSDGELFKPKSIATTFLFFSICL